jgi:hypothetical protein
LQTENERRASYDVCVFWEFFRPRRAHGRPCTQTIGIKRELGWMTWIYQTDGPLRKAFFLPAPHFFRCISVL